MFEFARTLDCSHGHHRLRNPLRADRKHASLDNDFVRLAGLDIHGNGHFMVLEQNNLCAEIVDDGLRRTTP